MTQTLHGTARTRPVRWALVGYGAGGRVFHAPLIRCAPGLDLVAVVTRSPERAASVRRDLPGVEAVSAIADLAGMGVEAVTVSTPTASHADVAHVALDAGLHVVVDKPFAMTAAAAASLVEHGQRAGRVLVPYQNRRWDSDFLTVRRLVDDGSLGTVHRFVSRIDRWRPVKTGWHGAGAAEGGGALLDLGPHLVDQALVLLGPVRAVHAELQTIRPGAGAEDCFEIHLEHTGGGRSTLAAGLASAAPGPRLLVHGDRAGYVVDGFDGQEALLKAGQSPASIGPDWGSEPESAWGVLWVGESSAPVPSQQGAWDTFYPAVGGAIRGGGAVPVDPADAVATARVIDAARESARADIVVRLGG